MSEQRKLPKLSKEDEDFWRLKAARLRGKSKAFELIRGWSIVHTFTPYIRVYGKNPWGSHPVIEGWVKHLGEPDNDNFNGFGTSAWEAHNELDYSRVLLERLIEQGPICTDTGKPQDIVKMKLWIKKLEGKKERLETLGLYRGDYVTSDILRQQARWAKYPECPFDSDLDQGICLLRDRISQALKYIDSVVGEDVTVLDMSRKGFELWLKILLDEKKRRETIPDIEERKAHYKEFYRKYTDSHSSDEVSRAVDIDLYEAYRWEHAPNWVEFPENTDNDELDDGICLLRDRISKVEKNRTRGDTETGETRFSRNLTRELRRGVLSSKILSAKDIVRMKLWLKKLLDEKERRESLLSAFWFLPPQTRDNHWFARRAEDLEQKEGWVEYLGPGSKYCDWDIDDDYLLGSTIEILEERIERGLICIDTREWLKKLKGKEERLRVLGRTDTKKKRECIAADLLKKIERWTKLPGEAGSDLDDGIRLLRDRISQNPKYIDSVVGEDVMVLDMSRPKQHLQIYWIQFHILDEKERRERETL